jgi:hypothetical protein
MSRRDEYLLDGRNWPKQGSVKDDWQLAWHGTSPESAFLIADQGLQIGSGSTGGKVGIYFHKGSKCGACDFYAVWSKLNPLYPVIFTAVVEALVNRAANDARSIHGQWVHQPESVRIMAIHFGMLPIKDIMRFKGKLNVAMKDAGPRAKELFDIQFEEKLEAAMHK